MDEPAVASASAEPAPGRGVGGPDTMPPVDRPGTKPDSPGPRWQLHRSVRDRKIKGVAGGVAAAADIDPTLVRLLFAVAAFSGWGIVAYIVLAVVVQDETADNPSRPLPRDQRRMLRIGLGVAAAIAVGRLFDGWFFIGKGIGLPFLLIAGGAAVLWARRDQPPGPPVPPVAPDVASASSSPEPTGPDVAPPPWPTAAVPPLGGGVDWRSTGYDILRLAAAFVAVGAALALLGGTFLVVVGAVPVRLPFLPAAVGTAGLLSLIIAVVRRGRPARLFFSGGVLVVAAALAVGLASFPGGAGNRIVVIGPGVPLLERYEHSAGRLVLDLRSLSLEPAGRRRVVARVGTGQLTVIVPPGLATDVEAQVGVGATRLFGQDQSGAGVDVTASHTGAEGAARLILDLDVGVGQIGVEVAPEPTFDVTCQVPGAAKGDGTDAVSCPHPAKLTSRPMSCSVALVDPEGGRRAGQAYCRAMGGTVPRIGVYAAPCEVPGESDSAVCAPLTPAQLLELAGRRSSTAGNAPSVGPGLDAGALACGPPDPTGERTCTTAPAASTSTTVAASYRCRENPSTKQLACVPA